jgi:hypothetical protein
MKLKDFLSTLKSNIKVYIVQGDETYTVYTDSLPLLDEAVQESEIIEWEVADRVSLKVTLEDAIPSG